MTTRKYRSQSEWLTLFQQYTKCELTSTQFCQRQELDLKYFLKRKRAFEAEQVTASPDSFVKVSVPSTHTSSNLILHYQAVQLHLASDTSPQWLAQLMKALS